jgi:hypothetical protein
MTNKCIYRYVNLLYYKSVASYMFRPPIVDSFREMFFEVYIT